MDSNLSKKKRFYTDYPTTPSQASSAWDWENFYPPSPPDSEFFNKIKEEREKEAELKNLKEEDEYEDEDASEVDDEGNREEVHCSEWGNNEQHHYSSSSTSSTKSNNEENDEEEEDDKFSRSDAFGMRSEFDGTESMHRQAPSEIGSSMRKTGRFDRASDTMSTSSASASVGGDMKMVVRHRDLVEIVAALEEYFVKAAAAGEQVSEILETGRAQLDRSFRQLKKTVYHSNSVLSALSSTWTSKPPLAIKYSLDTGNVGGVTSLGSTMEKLLAWEKKLYEEVKAREGVKLEHEKKLSTLQSLEYKGRDDMKMDKTKASIQKLQQLILVTSQAVATTSVAITKVRDCELSPQLVNLCYSLLSMWRAIHHFHELQNNIVQQVRGLIHRSSTSKSTSDLHRFATRDLEAAVTSWHSNFNRLIRYQREYIRSIYGWLKLTLIHVNNDDDVNQNEHSSSISVKLTAFCDEWKQALDRLPDTVASEAIKSFVNVVHVIYTKQEEELKIKKKTETYSKELDKKSSALRAIEKKFYQSYSTVGIGISGASRQVGDGQVFHSRDPLAEKKHEIAACRRKVEDEMTRHAKAVEVTRSMTLNNIQTGLPGVFQAMAGFSGMFVEAMEGVCRKADYVI